MSSFGNAIKSSVLTEALKWRYATKIFDREKKIPDTEWKTLEETLVLTPSSYGLQPWKFFVVDNPTLRLKLFPNSWKQPQVVDASHFVVFAIRTDFSQADIDRYIKRMAEVKSAPEETFAPLKGLMTSALLNGKKRIPLNAWASNQLYIALGNLMTSAALLGIDTCPMEGIVPEKYDEVLGLEDSGYKTAVACALGYRNDSDKYSVAPKIRYKKDEVICHI